MQTLPDRLLAELDALISTQARLQFARKNYNDDEATNYGVRLLDFMRQYGVALRAAVAGQSLSAPDPAAALSGSEVVADEEVIPCEVAVAPATTFSTGCKLSSVIESIRLRATVPGPHKFTGKMTTRIDHAPQPGDGWRPIAEAPRDGTSILITGGTYSVYDLGEASFDGRVGIARWDDLHSDWHGAEANAHDEYYSHKPTMFRPLPAAPSAKGVA